MSKRPLQSTSTGEPNRKRSSFRFARNPSEVVVNSTKVGQLPSGRRKQTKQNLSTPESASSSTISADQVVLPQDQPLHFDDLNSTEAVQVDLNVASEVQVLSTKPKRKKRTNTTSVSSSIL